MGRELWPEVGSIYEEDRLFMGGGSGGVEQERGSCGGAPSHCVCMGREGEVRDGRRGNKRGRVAFKRSLQTYGGGGLGDIKVYCPNEPALPGGFCA